MQLTEFKNRVDDLITKAKATGGQYVLAGDFNSKAREWGSPVTDARGIYVNEWVAAEGLVIHNDGRLATGVRPNGESFVDLMISTRNVARRTKDWRGVSEDVSLSDHRYIWFRIEGLVPKATQRGKENIDPGRLREILAEMFEEEIVPLSPGELCRRLKEAQRGAVIGGRDGNTRVPYWWNAQIEEGRKACIQARRALQRARGRREADPVEVAQMVREYRAKKVALTKEIKSSKREEWRKLCKKLEDV